MIKVDFNYTGSSYRPAQTRGATGSLLLRLLRSLSRLSMATTPNIWQ